MMNTYVIRALFLLVSAAVSVFGLMEGSCSAKRDSLVVCMGISKLNTLDPIVSITRQVLILSHNWNDTLLYRDPVSRKIVPCLSKSYRFINDRTLEFSLREGIQFHNGEPFNAHAVKFSLELIKNLGSPTSGYLKDIEEGEVVDEHTIRITLKKPNPTVLEVIANTLFIYPPHYYKEVGRDHFGKRPVGTGPYRFVSWESPNGICFEANTDYFGGPKGLARIRHLEIVDMPEELPPVEALVKGTIDLVRSGTVFAEYIPFLEEIETLKIVSTDILRTYFLCMDARCRSGASPFKDRKVRRAVNCAIDREKLVQNTFGGKAQVSVSVTNPLHFGHEPNVRQYAYNPERARRLLREAGYPRGFSTDFYMALNESASEAIADYLEAVGIRVNRKWMGGKMDTLYQSLLAGKLPLVFMTWGSYSIFDASAIMNPFFMLDSAACYGTTPEIDRLLRQACDTMNPTRRMALFSDAQEKIAEEAFWVPICSQQAIYVMNRDLDFQPSVDEIDRYFTASWVSQDHEGHEKLR